MAVAVDDICAAEVEDGGVGLVVGDSIEGNQLGGAGGCALADGEGGGAFGAVVVAQAGDDDMVDGTRGVGDGQVKAVAGLSQGNPCRGEGGGTRGF